MLRAQFELRVSKKHLERCFFGLPEQIRTVDLQSRSLTRYPAVPRVGIFN